MPAVVTLKESSFTYLVRTSNQCAPPWMYTIVVNQDGTVGVRNIQSPYGLLCSSTIQIPEEVLQAIEDSKDQVEDILSHTGTLQGTLNFVDQSSQAIVFATPFNSVSYQVHVTIQDFYSWKITNKTVMGFTIELGITYTGIVQYIVFV